MKKISFVCDSKLAEKSQIIFYSTSITLQDNIGVILGIFNTILWFLQGAVL